MEKKKTILLSAAVVMVAVGGFWMLGSSEAKSTVSFATENVKKSNMIIWFCQTQIIVVAFYY